MLTYADEMSQACRLMLQGTPKPFSRTLRGTGRRPRERSCQHRGAVRRRHGRVESKVPSDPGVHRAGRCKSAKQSQTGREATGRVSEFRASRPRGFQHNVGYDARLVAGLEDHAQLPAPGRTRLTGFIELRVGFQQVRVELRLRVRRLDDRDSDPPRAELMVE